MTDLPRMIVSAQLALLRPLMAQLPPGSRSWLARQLMRDRRAPATLALAEFFAQALMAWKNKQYDVNLNGEAALLGRLLPFGPRMLFDVGANVGEWSIAACGHLPAATVHAFEIAAPTAAQLREAAASRGGRIIVNACGLGDREGEITIFHAPESDTATSTLRAAVEVSASSHNIHTITEMAARITTGDAYLQAQDITHVDMLKIDVEGAEFAVLNGFAGAFERRAITLVQFEYGEINLRTRAFLADFYDFFVARGFVLGKLYPDGVAFKPYALADEDFVGPNYIACLADRTDLIAALSCH